MKRLTIDDNYIVSVKSNFDGTLIFNKGGYNEKWYSIGDAAEMPWEELKDIRKFNRNFFENNWIMVESDDEYKASQFYEALGVSQYYPNADQFKDVDAVLSMKPKEMTTYLKDKSQEYRETLYTYAKRLIEEKDARMDSNAKRDTLEKVLGVSFDEV